MFGAQAGLPQPPQWQQGLNQGAYRGAPPTKKPKNNPIITRYAPPPGYKGPAQPPPQFQQQAWQQPQQAYPYGQQAYPGYPSQGYGAPQPYQQPPYQQPPYQQPPYQGFAPQQQYPGAAQSYYPPQPQTYGTAPQTTWQPPTPAPQSAPPQHWPSSNTLNNQVRHNSAPYPAAKPTFTGDLDGNGEPLPQLPPQPALPVDDLEDDYLGECYYARRPDEINPDLSLGLIDWRAALPTRLPLPSTFAEAELEALAPRNQPPLDEDSISEYFVKAKRDEALLSVRQTPAWAKVKDDLVFKELPAICARVVSKAEMLKRYMDRRDHRWSVRAPSPTPEPEPVSVKVEPSSDASAGAMDVDCVHHAGARIKSEDVGEQADVLGNLEQALQQNGTSHAGLHSRASSIVSMSSQRITRPKAVAPIRDRDQEDILASLGVTGSPKMVYQTPGPAFGPPPPQREDHKSRTSRHNSLSGNGPRVPLPPPPPPVGHQGFVSNKEWRTNGQSNGSRPSSSASHHTATGSDFGQEDQDATPRPKMNRTVSRKRSFADSEDDTRGGGRQEDDPTPKQRRKQPRVDDVYSRRW